MLIITTERLTLEPFSPADVAELSALFREASVRRYLLDDTLVSHDWVRFAPEDSR